MGTKSERIAEILATTPKSESTSLYHSINVEMLMQCHKELDGKKTVGIDKVTKAEYKEHLEVIYGPRFLNCMYGFRPNRGRHDAIK